MLDPAGLPLNSFAFFGYPSRPELSRETLAKAAQHIGQSGELKAVTWEQLDVTGRLIIDRITEAIDRASVSVFDITNMNENVMFEVGYAIGANRQIWLVRDPSDEDAERQFKEVAILVDVGYESYENSHELASAFSRDRPFERPMTIFEESIEPGLDPVSSPSIFYMRSPLHSEAEREIGRSIDRQRRAGIRRTVADPRESTVESLGWYAHHCYSSSAAIVHLLRPGRRGADVHNARCALISGLAHGMGRPVLMLVEQGYKAPIDYRDLLYVYKAGRDCSDRLNGWLKRSLKRAYEQAEAREAEAERRSLSTELAGLRLGEPVAENEADRLSSYFVKTGNYRDVITPRSAVFVGRRGSGKTANFIQAASDLDDDRRNLVCTIQPSEYDLDGLVRLLTGDLTKDAKGYVVESLWKYLLISEIALAALDDAISHPAPLTPGEPAWELNSYVQQAGLAMSRDFAVRLESAVASVMDVPVSSGIASERTRLSEALHATLIHKLIGILRPVLRGRRRVAVLIDNLDQSWETTSNVDSLAQLLLGLLVTGRKVGEELAQDDTDVTLSIFIRADIFSRVSAAAREPDKIPTQFLTWNDPEILLQVIEERYVASRKGATPGELWSEFFAPRNDGRPMREYLATRVLPRPRDIVYLTNAAIEFAVRHRHPKVLDVDIAAAERQYSQFAFEALLVEGGGELDRFEDLLFEFAGMGEIVSSEQVDAAVDAVGYEGHAATDNVIRHLVGLSFLGQEIRDKVFEFAEDPRDRRRLDRLATKLAEQRSGGARFRIHPAFHAYLDIASDAHSRQESLDVGAGN